MWIEDDEESVVDYTEEFSGYRSGNNYLLVQGRGNNVLALNKLPTPVVRSDGKRASYELEYRWLSQSCEHSRDQAYVMVTDSEFIYLQRKEVSALLRHLKKGSEVVLFDYFNLF